MTRARALAALLALGAVTAVPGCSALHARQPMPGTSEGEWGQVRLAATRRRTLYDGLVHRATATATHLGLREREARTRRLGEWLVWTPAELDRHLADDRAAAAAEDQFVLAFYTADSKVNDLDAPSSVWRVAVSSDGKEYLPSRIETVDSDATVRTLYPFVGTFDVVYVVHVPRPPEGLAGTPFVLRIASALGKIELDYAAEPEDVEQPAPAAPAP